MECQADPAQHQPVPSGSAHDAEFAVEVLDYEVPSQRHYVCGAALTGTLLELEPLRGRRLPFQVEPTPKWL